MAENPYSLYLHIPFCTHRCAYCDFNTYAGLEDQIPAYSRALQREIALVGEACGRNLPVHTLFFGGGTPSLLPLAEIENILAAAGRSFDILPGAEITLEANPGTLTETYLRGLFEMGVNRLSLGMQSANPLDLQVLERQHDYFDVVRALQAARRVGFSNINLDLIFGLPYQTLESWQHTLELAVGLAPEHLALYALTLEHGTPMQHWTARGLLPEPDPDLAADMYEAASATLAEAGYQQYEISNWAAESATSGDYHCRHNLQYWRSLPYLGFGAGAHGSAAGFRTANVRSPQAYIQRCLNGSGAVFPRSPAAVTVDEESTADEMGIFMMMGLRLTREGVGKKEFERRFGSTLVEVFPAQIAQFIRLGLLEWSGEDPTRLRLTTAGRLLGNQVFQAFI